MPLIRANLPEPEYDEFIGREEDIALLRQLLSRRERLYLVSVQGMGGIGKTALAIAVCYQLQYAVGLMPEDEYDYIVWTSAKPEDMTPSGPIRRPQSRIQNTFQSILTTIADVMGLATVFTSASKDEQEDIVLDAMSKSRVLVVIDSFEQLRKPVRDAIIAFFHRRLPYPSKLLITTRPQEAISQSEAVLLKGLQEEEGIALIIQLYGPNRDSLSSAERERLFHASSGNPLAIRWAVGRMVALGESFSSVVFKLEKGVADLSEYCVADSFEAIKGRKAEEIAHFLLPVRTFASRQTIGEIVGLSREISTRDSEIELLTNLQLVMRSREDKYRLAPMARSYLFEHSSFDQTTIRRAWANYYLNFVQAFVGKHGRLDTYLNLSHQKKLWAELENVVGILESIASIDDELYCALLEATRYLLYIKVDWVSRDQYMQMGIDAASRLEDFCRKLLFASDVGWVASYANRAREAFRFFEMAESALEGCSDSYYRAKFYIDYGRLYQLTAFDDKGFAQAEQLYLRALEEAEQALSVPAIQSTCLYYLGLLYYNEINNKAAAREQFEKGLAIAESSEANREADRHRSMIALISAENGHYEKAVQIFDQIIVQAQGAKDAVRIADYKFAFAKVEYGAGRIPSAQTLLTEAEQLYKQTGRDRDVDGVLAFRRAYGLER